MRVFCACRFLGLKKFVFFERYFDFRYIEGLVKRNFNPTRFFLNTGPPSIEWIVGTLDLQTGGQIQFKKDTVSSVVCI